MKFEDYKLKTDQYGFKFAKEDIMLGNREHSCFTCHTPTKFIELNAEAPFCSDECVDAFYKMYNEAIEVMEEELNNIPVVSKEFIEECKSTVKKYKRKRES